MSNLINSIGIDLVEHSRFENKISDIKFIKRILTDFEISIFNEIKNTERKIEYIASRFASKEAFSKALSYYDKNVNFNDIEIRNDSNNKPILKFLLDEDLKCLISISHTKNYSIAQVMLIK